MLNNAVDSAVKAVKKNTEGQDTLLQYGEKFMGLRLYFLLLFISILTGFLVSLLGACYMLDILPKKYIILSFLSYACPLTSLLLFISPIGHVISAVRNKKKEYFATDMYIVQSIANVMCVAYGINAPDSTVLYTNLAGFVCQIIWLCAYNYAADSGVQWLVFLFASTTSYSVLFFFCLIFSVHLVGLSSVVVNVCLYTVPFKGIGNSIKQKDAAKFPLSVIYAMVLCNAMWGVDGFLKDDYIVYLPSFYGYLTSLTQLLVGLYCHNKLHLIDFNLISPYLSLGSQGIPTEQIEELKEKKTHMN